MFCGPGLLAFTTIAINLAGTPNSSVNAASQRTPSSSLSVFATHIASYTLHFARFVRNNRAWRLGNVNWNIQQSLTRSRQQEFERVLCISDRLRGSTATRPQVPERRTQGIFLAASVDGRGCALHTHYALPDSPGASFNQKARH